MNNPAGESREGSWPVHEPGTFVNEESVTTTVDENPVTLEAYRALSRSLNLSRGRIADAQPHQAQVLRDIQSHLRQATKEGYIELATSTGKTYLIAKLTEAFYEAGLRTLILAPQIVIAEQIATNEDKGLSRFAKRVDKQAVGAHYGGSKASPKDPVVVSTYQGFNGFAKTGELGSFDVVLADEAHRSLGTVTKNNLLSYCPEAVKIGFTATPAYGVDKRVDEIFDAPMHSITLPEAIEMGLVAPVQCLVYTTDAEIPYLDSHAEFTQKEIERLMHLKARNERAVEFAKNFVADNRQGIIACVPGGNLAHARLLARDINNQAVRTKDGSRKLIRAAAVGSYQSAEDNARLLEEFEKGNIDVLTFISGLSEGWDSQRASFLINTCPTTSQVKITQMMGRVLREKSSGLDSIVVDFLDQSQRKTQATTLSALGQDRFMLGHVITKRSGTLRTDSERRTYLEGMLSPELWENLQATDSKLLSDLNVTATSLSPEEQLLLHYDRMLEKEGLYAEPTGSLSIPNSLIDQIERFKRTYYRLHRIEPDEDDVLEFFRTRMDNPPKDEAVVRRLATLALQDYDAMAIDPSEIGELESRDLTDELIDLLARNGLTRKVLDALPERERRILELRYGFEGLPWTREAIGNEMDLTRERVRQLDGQALSRISGLRELNDYLSSDFTPKERAMNDVHKKIKELDQKIETAKLKLEEAQEGRAFSVGRNDEEKQGWDRQTLLEAAYNELLYSFTKLLQEQNLAYLSAQENSTLAPTEVEITPSNVALMLQSEAKYRRLTGEASSRRELELRYMAQWLDHMKQGLEAGIGINSRLVVPLGHKGEFKFWMKRIIHEAIDAYPSLEHLADSQNR